MIDSTGTKFTCVTFDADKNYLGTLQLSRLETGQLLRNGLPGINKAAVYNPAGELVGEYYALPATSLPIEYRYGWQNVDEFGSFAT